MPRPIIIAADRPDLDRLIAERLSKHGPRADLNDIDVSNIEDFSLLFANTHFRGNVSQWNTSRATNMRGMFVQSHFDGDLSNWDVSQVEDMNMMFESTQFNGDLSRWDVAQVKDFRHMFSGSPFDGDISQWRVQKYSDMSFFLSNQEVFLTAQSQLKLPVLPLTQDMNAFFGYKQEPYMAWLEHRPLDANHWRVFLQMVALNESNDRREASGLRPHIQWDNDDLAKWPRPEMFERWSHCRDVHAGLDLGLVESAMAMVAQAQASNVAMELPNLDCPSVQYP